MNMQGLGNSNTRDLLDPAAPTRGAGIVLPSPIVCTGLWRPWVLSSGVFRCLSARWRRSKMELQLPLGVVTLRLFGARFSYKWFGLVRACCFCGVGASPTCVC